MTMETATNISGRLVLDDRVVGGSIVVEGGSIAAVTVDDDAGERPIFAPGFVDLHVHGWGGHDAMGDPERARRHGETAPAPRRDLVPADRGDRAARATDRLRRARPPVAAGGPG